MKKIALAALGAVTMILAMPAAAQEYPVIGGDFWDVTEVTIDDGHFGDYADFLGTKWRKQEEFAKSKGWTKGYYILANVNKRGNEPDLYLVRIFDHVPNAIEGRARDKEMNAYLASTSRQMDAESAGRAKFRHIGSSQLLQEMVWAK